MGQKVNPHGLRVGVIKDWDSRWYARPDKVGDLIRDKDVELAKGILQNTPNSGAALLYKVLCSACANAENNHEMDPSKLYVSKVMVTGGPTMKRGRASARGRYARILKRTSHITVVVAEKEA